MWVTVQWSGNSVGLLAVGPEFISSEQNDLLEPIPYGMIDTLLTLDTGVSELVLPSLDARFCCFPVEGLRSGWRRLECGEGGSSKRRGGRQNCA